MNLRATDHPEFDAWRWNEYWVPLESVIEFKRGVYEMALTELARFCHGPAITTATYGLGCGPGRVVAPRERHRYGFAAGRLSLLSRLWSPRSLSQDHVVPVDQFRLGLVAQHCFNR